MEIVLVEPEIPQNSGNIARLCAATNSNLHFVGKLGFSLSDRYLKRAGLDYWKFVNFTVWNEFDEFYKHYKDRNFYLATSKGKIIYSNVDYKINDVIIFGSETKGLPLNILNRFSDSCKIKIPFVNVRCLNVANSVSVILYEALKQNNFKFDKNI
jgi:tRNA (cytidine/uridine-2'-O-)-methyltransferase